MSDNVRYKLEQALLYIDQNINNKITVVQIAQYACLSSFHFHRVFALYLGKPLINIFLAED